MFLRRLCIKNYKSLKNVDFCPTNLSVLVGPNGAGKSNFASAIDFLSDVYRHGLEAAVTRKGGYENIAFRAERRSRSAIRFEVTIELARAESIMLNQFHAIAGVPPAAPVDEKAGFRLTHRFSFKAQKHDIDGDFKIEDESFDVRVKRVAGGSAGDYILEAELDRTNDGRISLNFPRGGPQLHELREYVGHEADAQSLSVDDG